MVVNQSYSARPGAASDTVSYTKPALGFMCVTTAGDISVLTDNGDTVIFKSVPLNTVIPVRIARINSTGTAATGLVALYPVVQP